MDESFEISINYKGKEASYEAKLLSFTYTYKIEVIVEKWVIWFERDDEGLWRGILKNELETKAKPPDTQLLQIIADLLKENFQ